MIALHEVASTDFLSLHGDWPVERVLDLLSRLSPTHALLRMEERLGYLFTGADLAGRLAEVASGTLLRDAVAPYEAHRVPVLDAFGDADDAPDVCLVSEGGIVVGVLDLGGPGADAAKVALRMREPGLSPAAELEAVPLSRWLHAELRDRVALHQVHSLLVYLSEQALRDRALPIALPLGSVVDIVVQPRRGFSVEGSSEGRLVITDEGETLPIQCKLRATGVGVGRVRVLAFFEGQPLGCLELSSVVQESDETQEGAPQAHRSALALPVEQRPDLSLLILEHLQGGGPAVTIRLTAKDPKLGLNLRPFPPILLRSDPLTFFSELFRDIEELGAGSTYTPEATAQKLAAMGSRLFESLFPEELQTLVWQLRDRISSVQIQSDESWIPWEICKLQGRGEDGRVEEGPFLCEAFEIARWIPGVPLVPSLRFDNLAVVAPRDSQLPSAPLEREYLLSLAGGGRRVKVIPAGFLLVVEALAGGAYDGWHFTGHGVFRDSDPNRSAILLEDREELRPADLSGRVRNLGRSRPLVFFNACQVGRGALSLTDVGGWASQWLRAGAGAFLGTYWSISDRPAFEFAQAFYDRLLAGAPLGRAAKEARLQIRAAKDPTYLAYTVYGDPNARVEEG